MKEKIEHYLSVIGYTYKINILQFIEYPTQVLPLLVAWLLFDLGQFYMINLMITQFRPFPGWSQYEVSFLYGYALLSEAIVVLFFYSTFQISDMVINGEFDKYMIKPLGVYPQFLFKQLNFVSISDLTSALILIIYSVVHLQDAFSALVIIKSIIFLVSAVLLRTAIFTFVNSISFWTKKTTSLHSICCFMTIRIPKFPLTVLPKLMQGILTFIFPVAFIAYFPVENIFGKALEGKVLTSMILILSVSVLLFILSVCFFQKGLKKYESAGA